MQGAFVWAGEFRSNGLSGGILAWHHPTPFERCLDCRFFRLGQVQQRAAAYGGAVPYPCDWLIDAMSAFEGGPTGLDDLSDVDVS